MAFRFIHTGDLHLDSPLKGLRGTDDPLAAVAADAPRRAFQQLVDIAIERKVDAVLIAGDLWDGDWSDMDAGLLVGREAARLTSHGIRVVAILGNHDAQSALTPHLRRLDALHVLNARAPETVDIGAALIHGQSFAEPAVHDNLVLRYPDAVAGRINVGLLHTGLDGARGHDPYAPCRLGDLAARGYDYFALGHVHTREILSAGPAAGGGTAAYCGVLQGRHVRETGIKGAFEVELAGPGAPAALSPIDLPVAVWSVAQADLSAADEDRAMASAFARAADALPAGCAVAPVRLVLTGASARHHALKTMGEGLREMARLAAANADARFLLEEVRIATQPPASAQPVHLSHAFDDEIRAAAKDPAVIADAAKDVQEVLSVLPPDVRAALLARAPHLARLAETGDAAPLLAEAADGLLARLRDEL